MVRVFINTRFIITSLPRMNRAFWIIDYTFVLLTKFKGFFDLQKYLSAATVIYEVRDAFITFVSVQGYWCNNGVCV